MSIFALMQVLCVHSLIEKPKQILDAIHALIPLAALVVGACQPASPPEEKVADPPGLSDINALRSAVAAAHNKNYAVAVANLYSEDAIWMPGHQPTIEGKAEIQAHLQPIFEANTVKLTITPAETQVLDGWAYDRGSYVLTITPKEEGEPIEEQGRYMVILRREPDGSWSVQRDIDNIATPLPTQ